MQFFVISVVFPVLMMSCRDLQALVIMGAKIIEEEIFPASMDFK